MNEDLLSLAFISTACQEHQISDALVRLSNAIKEATNDHQIALLYTNKALAELQLQMTSSAMNDINKAIKADSMCSISYFVKGLIFLWQENENSAVELWRSIIKLGGSIEISVAISKLCQDPNFRSYIFQLRYNIGKVLNTLSHWEIPKIYSESDIQLAYEELRNKHYLSAISSFTDIISCNPQYEDALIGRGAAYVLSGEPQLAIEDLAKLHGPRRNSPEVCKYRAAAYASIGHYTAAIMDLTTALTAYPNDLEALEDRAFLQIQRNMFALALDDLNKISKIKLTQRSAYYFLRVFYSMGNLESTLQYIPISGPENSSSIQWARFLIYRDLRIIQEAKIAIALAVKYDLSFPILKEASKFFLQIEQPKEAITLLDYALRIQPDDPDCLRLKAISLFISAEYSESLTIWHHIQSLQKLSIQQPSSSSTAKPVQSIEEDSDEQEENPKSDSSISQTDNGTNSKPETENSTNTQDQKQTKAINSHENSQKDVKSYTRNELTVDTKIGESMTLEEICGVGNRFGFLMNNIEVPVTSFEGILSYNFNYDPLPIEFSINQIPSSEIDFFTKLAKITDELGLKCVPNWPEFLPHPRAIRALGLSVIYIRHILKDARYTAQLSLGILGPNEEKPEPVRKWYSVVEMISKLLSMGDMTKRYEWIHKGNRIRSDLSPTFYLKKGDHVSPIFKEEGVKMAVCKLKEDLALSIIHQNKINNFSLITQPQELYHIVQSDIQTNPGSMWTDPLYRQLPRTEINMKFLGAYGLSIFIRPPLTMEAYEAYSRSLSLLWSEAVYFPMESFKDEKRKTKKNSDFQETDQDELSLSQTIAGIMLMLWNLQPISDISVELGYVFLHGIAMAVTDRSYTKFEDKNGQHFLQGLISPNPQMLSSVIDNFLNQNIEPEWPNDLTEVIDTFWKKQPSIGEILSFFNFHIEKE